MGVTPYDTCLNRMFDKIEEGNSVASLHIVYVRKKNSNQEVIVEVHAFFEFDNDILISCDERTRIIQGSKEDEDLGRRK